MKPNSAKPVWWRTKPLGRDQWSVKVEKDENYVWIYYSNTILDLDFLFTFTYTVMIKYIRDNIRWQRENIKFIGLVGPMGKMGCFSTLTVHLGLMVWGFSHHIVVTPFFDLWSFIFYLVLVPLLCVVHGPSLVWLLNLITFIVLLLCDHMMLGTLL